MQAAEESYTEPVLPKSTLALLRKVVAGRRHPGLQLDKLSSAGDQKKQRNALKEVTRTQGNQELLKALFDRQRVVLDALGAKRLRMTTRGSLTLHLSRSGALENAGIALHPVYGFVYLPGSGVKGLARAWAETVWAPAQSDEGKAWRRIEEAFGWSPGSKRHKTTWRPAKDEVTVPEGAAAGRLVFHDAWPIQWPRLILDVINNHHTKYYAGEDDPGDWEEPSPVYFLAVGRNEEFEFAVSDRKPGSDDLLDRACEWLRDALTIEGAGAKTAAGYGRFKPVEREMPLMPPPGLVSASFDLKLVTPAFLAGASQKQDDCDLRPATLRGLLRWWWRTMHAAHLDRATLKQLETAVWGDAESGSPVRLAVDCADDQAVCLYDYKDSFQPKPEFQRQHDLENPPNKKTTQGLFYASYGMDDDRQEGRKRWYRMSGSCWRVTLTARIGQFRGVPLPPQQLLEQANAALWLVCRFGGVGSRGRKGFGSFEDIQVEDVPSVEACQELAQAFRQTCRLPARVGETRAPTLERVKRLELQTPWHDPWTTLDQLGYAVQAFAQKYAHKEEKKALGLPRRVHGPRRDPIGHQRQNPTAHKQPHNLSATKGRRHAAPVVYHLANSNDGSLRIRVTALPSHYLPSLDESERMLSKLLDFLDTELRGRIQNGATIGQRRTGTQQSGLRGKLPPESHSHSGGVVNRPSRVSGLPKTNERVEAELLAEKTRNGGWKAKHLDSGLQGPIQDNQNVPADAEPGQRVTLTVAFANEKEIAFKWAEPPPPRKTSGQKGQRRQIGGRR